MSFEIIFALFVSKNFNKMQILISSKATFCILYAICRNFDLDNILIQIDRRAMLRFDLDR
jgi:hypothetical protein